MKPRKPAMLRIPVREPLGCCREPSLEEILTDPIIEAVMLADAVDPDELGAMLGQIGRTLRAAADVTPMSA